jgi:hypothetical protein
MSEKCQIVLLRPNSGRGAGVPARRAPAKEPSRTIGDFQFPIFDPLAVGYRLSPV